MEYPTCIQSLKQKEFLLQLAQEKSSYFNRKYRLIRLFYVQKYINFIGSRSCPNLTKLGMEYPTCIQSLKQKEFLLQLAQEKSSYFNRKYRLIRLFYFQKYRNFIGSRSCPNVTKLGMEYPTCIQSLKQKEFLLQLAQEKSSYFNRKYRLIRLFYFQKYRNFIESRSCPNLTKLGMEYSTCIQSLKQKEFLLQLAQEKSSYFNRKSRLIRLFYFQKYRNFIGSRSCPNVTKLGMEYPTYIQSLKQKKFLLQLAQEKSSYFNRKYRLIRLFYFQKYRNFIGSRSCPILTKLGMEYPTCIQSLKQKEFLLQLVQEKSSYFNRKYLTYSLILFSKIQKFYRIKELSKCNQTQYGVSHVYLESKTKRIFAIACLGKKFVFQSEV